MTFSKAVGFNGASHDSKSEAKASFFLADFGIFASHSYLPLEFLDSTGEAFRAKSDFHHAPTGVLFEFKDSSVNGVGTKAVSQRSIANSRSTSERAKALNFGWNHSAEKLGIVQRGISGAGGALVALFGKTPDDKAIKRLNKRGIFWLVLGSPGFRLFTNMLKLTSAGLACWLTYTDDDGQPLHQFATVR